MFNVFAIVQFGNFAATDVTENQIVIGAENSKIAVLDYAIAGQKVPAARTENEIPWVTDSRLSA